MLYTGDTKTAIACSFLENNPKSAETAMEILLADYKALLAENTALKSENLLLKEALETAQENTIFDLFLPKKGKRTNGS